MDIQVEREVSLGDLIALYDSVRWAAYTRAPDTLETAIANPVFYLQDILVRPEHQRTGIGRHLLASCLERYSHVRQKVLLTDDDDAQQRFYESLGDVNTTSFTGASLNAYVRFDA